LACENDAKKNGLHRRPQRSSRQHEGRPRGAADFRGSVASPSKNLIRLGLPKASPILIPLRFLCFLLFKFSLFASTGTAVICFSKFVSLCDLLRPPVKMFPGVFLFDYLPGSQKRVIIEDNTTYNILHNISLIERDMIDSGSTANGLPGIVGATN
jgi:hypothetical protein